MRCRGRRPRRPVTRPRFVPGMIQWRWLPICHCEEAAGRRGNLAGPGWITGQLRRIRKLVREIATGAKRPRNDNSEVHTILTMACTDRQHCAGPGCPLPYNGVYGRREYPEICSCHRRSVSAATDAIGWCVFIGTLYELEVPSRDCHVGLRPPRNDKSGAVAVLTMARSEGQCLPEIAPPTAPVLRFVIARPRRGRGNLAVLSWMTRKPRRIRGLLQEIPTSLRSSQ